MKLSVVLLALTVAISAMPHHIHDHGANNNNNNNNNNNSNNNSGVATTAIETPQAAATNVPVQNNRGGNRGNHNGNPQGQNGQHSSQVAATTTAVAAQPPATTVRGGGQATSTVVAGQNGNTGQATPNGSINPALVPDFGQQAGLQPDGTGNCKSDAGKTIPCQCPPDRNAFIAKLGEFVKAGSFFGTLNAPFPTGSSNADALTRIDTIISTLQNFDGSPGKGCPAVSAPNFSVVQQNLLKAGA